jgi:hypothetical protein
MKLIHYVGTNRYELSLKVTGSRCVQMRLRKLTDKAKNIDAQAGGGIQSFFNRRTTDANKRTAANASMSAATTPAATIEAAGTNTKAAGTNAKRLACSSLQSHSFSDNEDADGEHPARKRCRTMTSGAQPPAPELRTRNDDADGEHPACRHRQTTTSGAQPSAPELRTRNDDADGEHPARKHCQTTTSGAQSPAPELRTRDNNDDELPWVAEDSDEDDGLYDDDGKGGDT